MNNTNPSKKGLVVTIIVLVVIILILAAGVAYLTLNRGPVRDDEALSQTASTTLDVSTNTNTPAVAVASDPSLKTYSNPEYGFSLQYPIKATLNDHDITGGREISITPVTATYIQIDVQNKEYGNQSSTMVPAQCDDGSAQNPSSQVIIGGIAFLKTDVSDLYGGMQIWSIAYSYCVQHNGIRYRIVPRISYSRYPCQSEKDGSTIPDCVKPTIPSTAEASTMFDGTVKSLNFMFTN